MADHPWFIPVSTGIELDGFLNVQWSSSKWPSTVTNLPTVTPTAPNAIFPQSTVPPASPLQTTQLDCHGQWAWESKQALGTLTDQAQLLVSTVFGANLCGLSGFTNISVYAKFMVNNVNRLEYVELSVNDSAGNKPAGSYTGNMLPSLSNNVWYIGSKAGIAISSFSGGNPDNLRVLLTFLGTRNTANVGQTVVSVEWLAIRLYT